jgi:hypothetical protein
MPMRALALLGLIGALLAGGPVFAHAQLVEADPASGELPHRSRTRRRRREGAMAGAVSHCGGAVAAWPKSANESAASAQAAMATAAVAAMGAG